MQIEIECPKCGNSDEEKFTEIPDGGNSLGAWECDKCETGIHIQYVTSDAEGEPENV